MKTANQREENATRNWDWRCWAPITRPDEGREDNNRKDGTWWKWMGIEFLKNELTGDATLVAVFVQRRLPRETDEALDGLAGHQPVGVLHFQFDAHLLLLLLLFWFNVFGETRQKWETTTNRLLVDDERRKNKRNRKFLGVLFVLLPLGAAVNKRESRASFVFVLFWLRCTSIGDREPRLRRIDWRPFGSDRRFKWAPPLPPKKDSK